MSSLERDTISKILIDRDLTTIADAGITPAFFIEYEHREAFKYILEHKTRHGEVPSPDAFHARHDPQYRLSEPPDALSYYTDMLTRAYRVFLMEDSLMDAVDLFDEQQYEESERVLSTMLKTINTEIVSSRVTDLTQTGKARLERYKTYAKNKGLLKGISSGFDSIDFATGGFQRKQLVTMVGPPKAGKTTIMLLADMAAHRDFFRPLFIGFEMTNEEQEERHDAIRAKVSHKALREGRLSGEDVRKLEKMMRRMEAAPPMVFSEDASSTMTLSGVAAQIDKSKPDVAFIDGVYMMEDEQGERKGSPQALTNITRGFKTLAKSYDIPVVISTQVLEWKMDRRKGITSSSIGYSSSFIQDSDVVIGVENTDEEDMKKLKVVLGRNAPAMETYVRWDWSTGDFEEIEADEYEDEEDPKF